VASGKPQKRKTNETHGKKRSTASSVPWSITDENLQRKKKLRRELRGCPEKNRELSATAQKKGRQSKLENT